MAEELQPICVALGADLASGAPLQELLELAADEQPEVRAAAFASSVALLGAVTAAARRDSLEPSIRMAVASCTMELETSREAAALHSPISPSVAATAAAAAAAAPPSANEVVTIAVAEAIPALLAEAASSSSAAAGEAAEGTLREAALWTGFVRALCVAPQPAVRVRGARALPILVSAVGGTAPSLCLAAADVGIRRATWYEGAVHAFTLLLANDADDDVVAAVAGALPPLASALTGAEDGTAPFATRRLLLPPLLDLLATAPAAALDPLLDPFASLLDALTAGEEDVEGARAEIAAQLVAPFRRLDELFAADWRRLHRLYATAAWAIVEGADPALLHAQLVPVLFERATADGAAAPTRELAAALLCRVLRRLRSAAQRDEICGRLVRELGRGATARRRLLFAYACRLLLAVDDDAAAAGKAVGLPPSMASAACACSRHYFKARGFFDAMLDASRDAVPNVRLQLCALLPALKRALRLPGDGARLEKLTHAAVALKSDGARDVRAAAVEAEAALRLVEVLPEGAPLKAYGNVEEQSSAEADAARFAEEEAVVRAEQEAAAEKLAEKAAHMRLAEKEPGQKVRASTSFDGVRPRRGSREIPVAPPAQASRGRAAAAGRSPWARGASATDVHLVLEWCDYFTCYVHSEASTHRCRTNHVSALPTGHSRALASPRSSLEAVGGAADEGDDLIFADQLRQRLHRLRVANAALAVLRAEDRDRARLAGAPFLLERPPDLRQQDRSS